MKQFFIKLTLALLPPGLIIVITNYLSDPAHVFSGEAYVDSIAVLLAKGHNVEGVSNYDERQLQEAIVKRIGHAPRVVVLGSSRIMEVGTGFFQSANVRNAGVSHANIHDLIAIAGMLDSMGKMPNQVLINVDPGLVSLAATEEWQTLIAYHRSFIRKEQSGMEASKDVQNENKKKKWYSLVSFSYFRESFNAALTGHKKSVIDAGTERPPNFGRYANGTICYPNQYTHPDTAVVRSNAANAAATASKEGLSLPDSNKIHLLDMLIDFFKAKHVSVDLVMLPFHPAYYQTVNARQQNLFVKYEQLFREMAAEKRVSIYGGFNPSVYGISGNDFYDIYHCSGTAIKKILNKTL